MSDVKHELMNLNQEIGRAEFERNITFLKECLAAGLLFRRAGGAIVDRETY